MWKNNRPEDWEKIKDEKFGLVGGDFEDGADALFEAMMKQRPSNDEIKAKFIACLYGGSDVPELLEWLKEKLLVRED